jgi:hypothetical protein
MIRRHENDPLLCGSHSIERIEQSRERYRTLIPVFACLDTFVERRIDVFKEDNTSLGRDSEKVIELIVRETAFREVEKTDIVAQIAGKSLDKRGLA